jgi:FOG: Ankyrin repeat
LAAGADVEIRDKEGETALTLAADFGNTDVVQALLGAGADANMKNGDGGTALMAAAAGGNADRPYLTRCWRRYQR